MGLLSFATALNDPSQVTRHKRGHPRDVGGGRERLAAHSLNPDVERGSSRDVVAGHPGVSRWAIAGREFEAARDGKTNRIGTAP